jgi:hypothetical protein
MFKAIVDKTGLDIGGFISKIVSSGVKAATNCIGEKANFFSCGVDILDATLNIFGLGNLIAGSNPKPDAYLPYLEQINQTTFETLQRVIQLQSDVSSLQLAIKAMEYTLSALIECSSGETRLSPNVEAIRDNFWDKYIQRGPRSVLALAADGLRNVVSDGSWDNSISSTDLRDIADWSSLAYRGAGGEPGIYSRLLSIHKGLIGEGISTGSVIGSCARLIYTKAKANPLWTLDDRQYFDMINLWLLYYLLIQAYGVRMLQVR